jgi:hypothetical protein
MSWITARIVEGALSGVLQAAFIGPGIACGAAWWRRKRNPKLVALAELERWQKANTPPPPQP